MNKKIDLVANKWSDYELIDSGDNSKLERYGDIILSRPETQAIWNKSTPSKWSEAKAFFSFEGKKGSWKTERDLPDTWKVSWKNIKLFIKLTAFKHTGIFPEQSKNWEWIEQKTKKLNNPKVLNLFGYTGAASIVASLAGADVTHIDASKQSLTWAHENAKISKVKEGSIRYLLDDVLRFVKREVRRGTKYDGIILDPPAFGRGSKGEVWHIEKDLPILINALHEILSESNGSFFVLSGYASGYSSSSFMQLTKDIFTNTNISYGELSISETVSNRIVPAGIYVRFARGLDAS